MNKAQELIKWFKENGNWNTSVWDLEHQVGNHKQVDSEITGTGRWDVFNSAVWQFDDNSYVKIDWAEGATEYQDDTPPDISISEVEPYETTVVKYKEVKNEV